MAKSKPQASARRAKARYDDLAVGRKRDKDWWNDVDPRKQWQHCSKDEIDESVPTPSRSILGNL